MNNPALYTGSWPKNVSKLAKYSVRLHEDEWKVTVFCDVGEGMRFLAVQYGGSNIPKLVNSVKLGLGQSEGGTFYINEYCHLVVPIKVDNTSYYYFAGKIPEPDFQFKFEGEELTSYPKYPDGRPLSIGDEWVGPRPGIPYVVAAGGADIYYRRPAISPTDPSKIRERVELKVKLSKVCEDKVAMKSNLNKVTEFKGSSGGRFYINEHHAIFAPVSNGDGDGINYIYCGQLNMSGWFPEPIQPAINKDEF